MLWDILVWIVFGLIVGLLARLLHPGRDAMGMPMTILLGVCGSLLGGGVSYLFRGGSEPFSPAGFLASLIGAIVLLALGIFGRESAAASARKGR